MAITVDLQVAASCSHIPRPGDIENWVTLALRNLREDAELTVRIVDEDESRELNERWRKANGPTNVLSFPVEDDAGLVPDLMGDVVICAQVVEKEAREQKKALQSHWAHMVVHGTLHLAGYDHLDDAEAEEMESLEIGILAELGIPNPYLEQA